MLPTRDQLRATLVQLITDLDEQGHLTDGLRAELDGLEPSYDALIDFAHRLADLPMREDWPFVEPDEIASIRRECAPQREVGVLGTIDADEAAERVRAAFLGRVCGCVLGKPFEIDVTSEEIEDALTRAGDWPLTDYATEAALRELPTLQPQWRELARGHITHVAIDDDINYTILGMLLLEHHGSAFTRDDLRRLWLMNLPALATFGPERTILIRSALHSLARGDVPYDEWVRVLNPGAELCGALIRADAYGYAAIGRPELAAELAHRDASFTHRRTGVYGSMFVAAAIAAAPFVDEPLDAVRVALSYVPQRSRFAERVRSSTEIVEAASDWRDAHANIRMRFGEYGFCRVYQEVATLINTLAFARSVGDGICMQVMQGLDTDSFGATAGSVLGMFFGAGGLDDRWTRPFGNRIHTALANFHESSLDALADRIASLPALIET